MGIGDFINDLGDSIEEGLESATEKVGQAYNSALDTWSGAAKAVGADGLSEWLDDAGDKIVDATGGAVPEKELGETTDPKELIRGEPAKIREVAEQLGQIGTAIDQTGDALRKIDVSDWTGDASTAFHEEFAKQPKLWWDGADAMGKAKGALEAWVHEVEAAQTKAAEAIAKWQAADNEERDRKNEWNAKSDEDRKDKSLTDTWTAMRDEARSILNGARTQRDNAANTAVTAITAATETAPQEPPFLSRWGSNFEDLGAMMEHAQANITTGLLTSLTGLVQFVRSVNPLDLYNATHPAEYMSKMSDMSTGMILAAADPKATASAMLAGFKANPTEALGALTGDALTTLATGGAGGAAKLTASTVNRVTDVADAGNTARNVLDNAAGAGGRNAPEAPSAPAQSVADPPDNPSAPATNPAATVGDPPAANPPATPEAPAANPANTSPDAPPTNPAAQAGDPAPTNPDAQSGEPAVVNPAEKPGDGTNTADNPSTLTSDSTPDNNGPENGKPEPPAAATPDNDAPNEPAPNPNNADEPPAGQPKPDTDESSQSGDDTTPDGNDNTPPKQEGAPSPDADDPATVNDGDPSHSTEPGGQDGSNNNGDPHVRSEVDAGGDGKPSVGEEAGDGGPASNSTRDQTSEGGDPVNLATGEFLLPLTDLDLPGVLRLVLKRAHHSNYRFGRWFGPSWSATLDMRVVVEDECVTVVFDDGMLLPYPHAEVGVGVEPITGGQRWKLTRTETGGYRLWDPDRELVWHFAPEPVLGGIDTLLGNFAISAITDRHQNRIRFHYNSNGDPVEVTHSGGYRVLLDTHNGRVTTISMADEEADTVVPVREFGYENGELTSEVNGVGGITRFAYDEHHRMLSWTDSNGSWVVNIYDEAGRVITQRGADGVFNADYEYLELGGGTGRLTRLTDSRGGVTGYGFDNDLRLRDFRAADGGRRHIDYNTARKPLKVTEPDGAITRYEYTADGDVAKIIRPDGTAIAVEYAYTNRPTTITHPDGTTVHREWDKAGNLVAVVDQAGARTEFTHHPCGSVAEVRDPDGAVTRIDVDAAGLPVTITDPYGATTEIRRDPFGRPVEVTDPLGQTTRYEWTPSGRPARRIDPDGFAETWTYDGENNLLTHTDRNGGVTRYTYGGFDKVSTRTDPDGSTTRYLYNTERQLIAVINPLGQRWTYEYDLAGRLIAETDYTGATTTYTHTITGRVATVTPATGITRHHRYDILGNLTSITADTGEYLSYTHDPAGRVLTAVNGPDETITHTLRFTYTPTGQVATQQLDDQSPLVNDYDHRGRRIRRTTPTGSVTTWRHNTLGQVTTLHADDTEISFNHDPAGRLTGWRVGEVQIDRTFTPIGNIATQQVTGFPAQEFTLDLGDFGPSTTNRPAPFTIRRDDYTYRPDGYLTHHTTTRPNQTPTHATYTLDPIGRVNTITRNNTLTEAYEYDPLSNITASLPTPSPDPAEPTAPQRLEGREYHNNLLIRDGRNHYYYDPAGRLIRKVTTRISRKPAVWHYRYNAFDQLTDVFTPEQRWWRYSYDALGRRTTKGFWSHPTQAPQELATYTYDASNLIEQNTTDATVRWNYLPRASTPLTQSTDSADASAYTVLLCDISGMPTEIVELSTARSLSFAFHGLWGNCTWFGTQSTPLRYPGQYADAESGLHYNYYRTYDPETGRYLSIDPLGLFPSSNPHAYPRNPTVWSDPLGLQPDYIARGDHANPFPDRESAERAAFELAGVPYDTTPDFEWSVNGDVASRGMPGNIYSSDPSHWGTFRQFEIDGMGSRVVVEHTHDPKGPHFHAGMPKGDPDRNFVNFGWDISINADPLERYGKIDKPRGDHHFFYE
ncbi:putative T7SS-secreted protein [Nocardia sp. NPDC050378]|uniref:putative T7SS-secreted protein n=1 Tax=Nocardia sp. NPDC050378 TaxID=3155400 RepID=UPI0033F1EAD8